MHHERQSTLSCRNGSFECHITDDSCFRVANGNSPSISYTTTIINFRFKREKLLSRSSRSSSSPAIIRHNNTNGSGNLLFSCGSTCNTILRQRNSDAEAREISWRPSEPIIRLRRSPLCPNICYSSTSVDNVVFIFFVSTKRKHTSRTFQNSRINHVDVPKRPDREKYRYKPRGWQTTCVDKKYISKHSARADRYFLDDSIFDKYDDSPTCFKSIYTNLSFCVHIGSNRTPTLGDNNIHKQWFDGCFARWRTWFIFYKFGCDNSLSYFTFRTWGNPFSDRKNWLQKNYFIFSIYNNINKSVGRSDVSFYRDD